MGQTVIQGRFEWDADKAEANKRKHGISFEEILPMFDDPLFWEPLELSAFRLPYFFGGVNMKFLNAMEIFGIVLIVLGMTLGLAIRIVSRIRGRSENGKREA